MPSSLESFEAFDALLAAARTELARMAQAEPGDGAIASVQRQLEALHGWTRAGAAPARTRRTRSTSA